MQDFPATVHKGQLAPRVQGTAANVGGHGIQWRKKDEMDALFPMPDFLEVTLDHFENLTLRQISKRFSRLNKLSYATECHNGRPKRVLA